MRIRLGLSAVVAALLLAGSTGIAAAATDPGGNEKFPPPKPLEHTLSEGAAAHANPDAPGISKKAEPGATEDAGTIVPAPVFGPGALSSAGVTPAVVLTGWTEQGPGPTLGGQDEGLTAQQNPVTGAVNVAVSDPANADCAADAG